MLRWTQIITQQITVLEILKHSFCYWAVRCIHIELQRHFFWNKVKTSWVQVFSTCFSFKGSVINHLYCVFLCSVKPSKSLKCCWLMAWVSVFKAVLTVAFTHRQQLLHWKWFNETSEKRLLKCNIFKQNNILDLGKWNDTCKSHCLTLVSFLILFSSSAMLVSRNDRDAAKDQLEPCGSYHAGAVPRGV